MSQVIVTKDQFGNQRNASAKQEARIDTESEFDHWRMNDISKPNPLVKLILGPPGLLVGVLFGGLLAILAGAIWVCASLMRALSMLVRPTSAQK